MSNGAQIGSGSTTFSVSGLKFQPTHFLVLAGTVSGKSNAVAVVSSDAPIYNNTQQCMGWYGSYGGSRGFTKTISSDGFSITVVQDIFLSNITYTWFAWTGD